MEDNDSKNQWPTASLKLDPESAALIESSKIKSFIGPLIYALHEKRIRTLSVMSWDSEDTAKLAAQVLTMALSQQIDRKCALVLAEGIRFNVEPYDCFTVFTVPEIETPAIEEQLEKFVRDMNANYPFQVLVAPPLKKWREFSPTKTRMMLDTDAQILLMPESGFSRNTAVEVERFTKSNKVTWLGIVAVQEALT